MLIMLEILLVVGNLIMVSLCDTGNAKVVTILRVYLLPVLSFLCFWGSSKTDPNVRHVLYNVNYRLQIFLIECRGSFKLIMRGRNGSCKVI
jgi:hypothetical protein